MKFRSTLTLLSATVLCLLFSLAACTGGEGTESSSAAATEPATEAKTTQASQPATATVATAAPMTEMAATQPETADTTTNQGSSAEAPVTDIPTEIHTDTPPTEELPTEAPTEAATLPEEMTMAPKNTLAVIENGQTTYIARISDAVAESNTADLDWLWRVMDEKYGTHPGTVDTFGIVPGEISFDIQGNARDFSVTVDETTGNITVIAGCAATMQKAIQYFATQFCGSSDSDLRIDVDGDYSYIYEEEKIDNSALLSYRGGTATVLAPSDDKGVLMTPTWLDTAIMVEVRLDTASIGGSFQQSYDLIDFYAATGVNVIWLTPIYERGPGGNGYGNMGLHTVEPLLTGTQDMAQGWQVVKEFTDYAHEKGIYILLDIVTWGTMKSAPLLTEHPTWFRGEAWGNAAFYWGNAEFKEWFISQAVTNILVSGADGYRCDCEPFTAGYDVFAEIRRRLNEQGVYPVIMSEEGGERKAAFDCEQDGVLDYTKIERGQLYQNPVNFFVDGYLNVVTNTKTGRDIGGIIRKSGKTAILVTHDLSEAVSLGDRILVLTPLPASVKAIIPATFPGELSPLERRNTDAFKEYFNQIWKELNPDEP